MNRHIAAATLAALALPHAFAQPPARPACHGTALAGSVVDTTLALIPNAALALDQTLNTISGSDGHFRFPCVDDGPHTLSVTAAGFAQRGISITTPHPASIEITLQLKAVETNVDINGDNDAATSTNSTGSTVTLAGKSLQSLADDPDDLLRELQQLAAAGGGNPNNVTIAVDGFQGSSSLPPKSSIAYIKVNPDLYSSEYEQPPFDGARVEVYTKPGQKAFHGALFTTNGSPWENARDPFSTSRAAIGKQRYGLELTGPVRKHDSDFALTLEHRSIDNFAVVNAITLDSSGKTVASIANVPTPQRLWLGTARVDWQIGAKNTFIATYSANINHVANSGVGGASLAETGYDSEKYEHMFRISDITTASVRAMHETRVSLRWDGESDAPLSSAQQVQVAGAFTGGGAAIGPQVRREFNVEADDDAILTPKNHIIKFGTQIMIYRERKHLTQNSNGSYTFGGGIAPVLDASNNPIPNQTAIISGIEQYRRTLLGLAGGTPTSFSNVTGNPDVFFTQYHVTLFAQDDWNVGHGLHIAYGVRYFVQDQPTIANAAVPRVGILWSPGKKGTWTLHAHAGMFAVGLDQGVESEVRREDGVDRVSSIVYNPLYGNPFANAAPIHSIREFAPHIAVLSWQAENIGGTRTLPDGWNLSLDYYIGRLWNDIRAKNVNSPLNGQPNGPRPGTPNLNVLQEQNSSQGRAQLVFASVEQHNIKHLQLVLGSVWIGLLDDNDDNFFTAPQSSTSNVGELARRSSQDTWTIFNNTTVKLPEKIELSTNLNAGGGRRYNITTGFDNNGDGNFNDRPQYAVPGTPGAIPTPWGLLVASGGAGVFPRNKGLMPWSINLDANIQREFKLTHNPKAEHQQSLTANVRSSNAINHRNVTQVGGVLGSPLFGVPYAADNGRRIEAGLRYAF